MSTAAVGVLMAATASLLVYRAARADQIEHATALLADDIATVEDRLASNVDKTRGSLLFVSQLPVLRALAGVPSSFQLEGAAASGDSASTALAAIFANLLAVSTEFLRIRLMDAAKGARDIVDVRRDESGEAVRAAAGSMTFGDRDHVRKAAALGEGMVHLSAFGLGSGNGEGSQRPTYRLATPVAAPGGAAKAVVIAEVDAAMLFAKAAAAVPRAARVYIADQDGNYLHHPPRATASGSGQGGRHLIQHDVPQLAALYAGGPADIRAQVTRPSGPHVLVARRAYISLDQPIRFLVIAALLPHASIASSGDLRLYGTAAVIAAMLMMATMAMAGLMMGLLVRPMRQVTAAAADVAAGRHDVRLQRHASRSDEIGLLARTFEEMAQQIGRREEELKKGSEELARSNQELTQFAYVASHDLQEPLRMVASYLGLLTRRYRGSLDSDADEFIGYAVDGAERMKRLINDLLSYSRVSNRALSPERICARSVVGQVVESLAERIRAAGAEIVVGELPEVRADVSQFERLVTNLIDNALKYRSDAPLHVQVSARRKGPLWEFSFADNGIGVDPSFAEKIFEIFTRLHGRDKYPGTGIGLSSCRRIVERHGGRIRVEPVAGGGSDFRFTWPAE